MIGRFTGRRGRASTMGLVALITTQLGQTAWAGRRSPLVLVTAAGSLAALTAIVQTPGVSQFFGCTPLGPVAWTVVLGSAAAATAGAEVARAREWHVRPLRILDQGSQDQGTQDQAAITGHADPLPVGEPARAALPRGNDGGDAVPAGDDGRG
jgi:hypothetical protein